MASQSTMKIQLSLLIADKEEQFVIAQANAPLTPEHTFVNPTVMARYYGESAEHPREEVQLMDVSPKQLVSGAAGLIPFLEHDDANRALMGSNMQRQAVPLMTTESPYVGTGLEHKIAVDSRAVLMTASSPAIMPHPQFCIKGVGAHIWLPPKLPSIDGGVVSIFGLFNPGSPSIM